MDVKFKVGDYFDYKPSISFGREYRFDHPPKITKIVETPSLVRFYYNNSRNEEHYFESDSFMYNDSDPVPKKLIESKIGKLLWH